MTPSGTARPARADDPDNSVGLLRGKQATPSEDSPHVHLPTERQQLGDYRIIKEIGRGGMGVVYEARQLSLDRTVALKVLPMAAFLDDRQLRRFKNEALAAASLQHPSIVSVHGVGCERSVHFYAMDLIHGSDLAEVIRELHHPRATAKDIPSENRSPGIERAADTVAIAQLSTQHSDREARFLLQRRENRNPGSGSLAVRS